MKKIICISLLLLLCWPVHAAQVKDADLSGSWYPSSREELQLMLKNYLDAASPDKTDAPIFAIISPHAGYIFSAPVAAYGFKAAEGQDVRTVIIIGFTHSKNFPGISVYKEGAFRTPLGDAAVDSETASAIIAQNKKISFEPGLFDVENSVEMQIPFVQAAFKDAKIVPVAFGDQSYENAAALAGALVNVLNGKTGYLIVASTDLSHYHPAAEADTIDSRTMAALEKMDAEALYRKTATGECEMCGPAPVAAVIMAAKPLGFDRVKILKYANSGDTYGKPESVVGYLSAAVYKGNGTGEQGTGKKEEANMFNSAQRKRLLNIARESMTSYVRENKRKAFFENDPALNAELGAFVTLHENGELRGCIGNMTARGPLCQTVADMAIEAAAADPRFRQVSPAELDNINIEISVLSPLKKVRSYQEIKIPGDGVIVRKGFASGVFLPQVATETGWSKEEFLSNLCSHKAGLPPDAWKDPGTELYVFTAEVFGEEAK